jgi:hypothetical protein
LKVDRGESGEIEVVVEVVVEVLGGRFRREWSRPMEPISDHEK